MRKVVPLGTPMVYIEEVLVGKASFNVGKMT
jgi:hypothetical protein